MSKPPNHSICLMTPARAADIEQFAVQRQSVQLLAPSFPHLLIVNTEDHATFADRFRGDSQLRIITSAAVLPSDLELRRRNGGSGWLSGKWRRHQQRLRESHARQLVKLYALATCSYEAAVFLDTDACMERPAEPADFYVGDRLKLLRRRAINAESLDFDVATHEILGNPLHQVTELYDYSCSLACFRKSTAVQLFGEFARRKRSSWVRRFISQQRPSEYNLLGYAAMQLEGGAGYQLIESDPDDAHHTAHRGS